MDKIANSFGSTYDAANWLRNNNESLGETPAEAIKKERINDVFSALHKKSN